MEKILKNADAKMTLFTGSSKVGEHLVKALKGKVRLEDGGYTGKFSGRMFPNASRISIWLLTLATRMPTLTPARSAPPNPSCSCTVIGARLAFSRR